MQLHTTTSLNKRLLESLHCINQSGSHPVAHRDFPHNFLTNYTRFLRNWSICFFYLIWLNVLLLPTLFKNTGNILEMNTVRVACSKHVNHTTLQCTEVNVSCGLPQRKLCCCLTTRASDPLMSLFNKDLVLRRRNSLMSFSYLPVY